jgi:hypothetical protein
MDVKLIEREIGEWLIAEKKKRDAQHRYLGFAHIGRCPRMLYDWFVNGGAGHDNKRAALNAESGLAFQRAVLRMLIGTGRVDSEWLDMGEDDERRTIRSGWDARFYGHIDARMNSGSIVEIKSFDRIGFDRVCATDKIGFAYYAQAQTYLRYGSASHLLFVAVSRDERNMLDCHLIELCRDDRVGDEMERKARMILDAVDGKAAPPECACGMCGNARGVSGATPRAPASYRKALTPRVVRDDVTRRMAPTPEW